MEHYRQKLVVIEAIQLTEEMFSTPHPNPDNIIGLLYDPVKKEVSIKTLGGVMIAQIGDWIIKGIEGEYYPCNPDIFEAIYEKVPFNLPE